MRRRRTATESLAAAARVAVVASVARTILTKEAAVATSRLQSHLEKAMHAWCFHYRNCQNETSTTMVVMINPILGRTLMRTTLLPPSVWLLVHSPTLLLLLELELHQLHQLHQQ
jgi:hypothetical protein